MSEPTDPLDPARALAAAATPQPPAVRDAHGFDPNDYDWVPVPRQRRKDGWTGPKQREFVEALADTGSVSDAARAVGMTVQSCYRLRRAADAAGFARAWDAAIDQAGKALLDLAFERIIHGEEVPVFDKDGQRIASKRRYSDRMTMFMLRGYFPGRFGAAGDPRCGALTQPPALPPVEAALAALEPARPAEPHKLMAPDDLADFIAAEEFNAAEQARFDRDRPEAAARQAAGLLRPAPPVAAAPPAFDLTADFSYDTIAYFEAQAAAAARAPRRVKRAAKKAASA